MKRLLSVLLALCVCIACVSTFAYASYSDLSPYHWAKEAIDRWTSLGALNGFPDGTFRPDEHMTRAQFAAFLSRALKLEKADISVLSQFADVNAGAWYAQTFANCVNAKIINGTSATTAAPDSFITRQEAAAMVCRAFGIELLFDTAPEFIDSDAISPWALPYIAALTANGTLNGYPDKTLKPRGFLTRAEAVFLISKAEALHPVYKEYSILVSISGFGAEGADTTLSRTLDNLSANDKITSLLTDIAIENRAQLWNAFSAGGMKDVMVGVLRAFAAGGDTWRGYAKRMAYAVSGDEFFKQACIDNSPVSSLIEGMPYTLEFIGYRLTVTLVSE